MASYTYPADITNNESSYLIFTRAKFQGLNLSAVSGSALRNIDQANYVTDIRPDVIALPVPNNFNDELNIGYTEISNTSVASTAAEAGKNIIGTTPAQLTEFASQSRVNSAQNALLFDSVSNKTWNFEWELIPESIEEARAIDFIIQEFTLASLPVADGAVGLKFPDLFKIRMGGVKSKLVNFLPCVITSVNSNLSSEYFQIYTSGYFPKITLSISFSELVTRTRRIQERLYNR